MIVSPHTEVLNSSIQKQHTAFQLFQLKNNKNSVPVHYFSTVIEPWSTTAAFIATGPPGTPGSCKAHPILRAVSKWNELLAVHPKSQPPHWTVLHWTCPMGHANEEQILEREQVHVYYQGKACSSILKVRSLKSRVSWEIHQNHSNFLDSSSLEWREPSPCLQPQFSEQS